MDPRYPKYVPDLAGFDKLDPDAQRVIRRNLEMISKTLANAEGARPSASMSIASASFPLGIVTAVLFQSFPLALNTSWVITHSMLSPAPAVTVIDVGGNDLEVTVVYNNATTITLSVTAAMSGSVYLS